MGCTSSQADWEHSQLITSDFSSNNQKSCRLHSYLNTQLVRATCLLTINVQNGLKQGVYAILSRRLITGMSLCGDSTLASTDVPIDGPERTDYMAGVNWQWGDLDYSYRVQGMHAFKEQWADTEKLRNRKVVDWTKLLYIAMQ